MFDLDDQVRRWRQELEATLAFSDEELGELEDHLRFAFEAKCRAGVAPELAWVRATKELGPASALAFEFAKGKLMPALGCLLVAWWRPVVLILCFVVTLRTFEREMAAAPYMHEPHLPRTWLMLAISFFATLFFLSAARWRNAVLVGTGLALAGMPLIHFLIYNPLTDSLIGLDWSTMTRGFGALPFWLGAAAILPAIWWQVRHPLPASERSGPGAVAAAIVFLLALAPCVADAWSNYSLHTLETLPDRAHLSYSGEALVKYLNWKFVDLLYAAIYLLSGVLPFVLLALAAVMAVVHRLVTGRPARPRDAKPVAFPACRDLPWILVLAASGMAWVFAHSIEVSFSMQARDSFHLSGFPRPGYVGMESVVLLAAATFLICQFELMQRLRRAARAHLFYSTLPLLIGILTALALPLIIPLQNLGDLVHRAQVSDEPAWLFWLLEAAVVLQEGLYALALLKKIRARALATSLWKPDGPHLVETGLLTGLVVAGSGLTLWLVSLQLAYQSTVMIGALLDWGQSIHGTPGHLYHPQQFLQQDHLTTWLIAGPMYLCGCFIVGLVAVLIASALEFIRSNGFRLYRVRKARREAPPILATND